MALPEASSMPQISVNGLDAFYRDEGSGVAVVLGHSSTASSGQWRELFKRMCGRYRLLAPDHIGYGRTPAYSGDIALMEQEIAIVEALVDLTSQPVHLVGHSFGGSILARVAVRRSSQVRSLTLAEPTLFYLLARSGRQSDHAEIKAAADRVIRYVGEGDVDEAARGFIDYWTGRDAYDAMDARVQEAVKASMAKLALEWPGGFEPFGATLEALSALQMPIQLIAGSRTTASARGVMDVLRALWPSAAYAQIEGAGHMAPVTHAAAVNEVIDTFIGGATA
jgi:pimeloyl-ACP methyl ester carboxylesterase